MKQEELIQEVAKEMGLPVRSDSAAWNRGFLAEKINDLLNNDFQKLISILYRQDINEAKLKKLLKENPGTDAGLIITDLMIERQSEKIKSRQQFGQRDNNIDEEEKW